MACLNNGWKQTNTISTWTPTTNEYFPVEPKEEILPPTKKEIQKQLSKDAIPRVSISDQIPQSLVDNRVSLIRKESKNEWSGKNFKRRK